jgi:hypothetical protein
MPLSPRLPDPAVLEVLLAIAQTGSFGATRGSALTGLASLRTETRSPDLAQGRLHAIHVDGPDLRRELRAIWTGGRTPPARTVRELAHIRAQSRR